MSYHNPLNFMFTVVFFSLISINRLFHNEATDIFPFDCILIVTSEMLKKSLEKQVRNQVSMSLAYL